MQRHICSPVDFQPDPGSEPPTSRSSWRSQLQVPADNPGLVRAETAPGFACGQWAGRSPPRHGRSPGCATLLPAGRSEGLQQGAVATLRIVPKPGAAKGTCRRVFHQAVIAPNFRVLVGRDHPGIAGYRLIPGQVSSE